MSCLNGITTNLSPEEKIIAAAQRLAFSLPADSPSKQIRISAMANDTNPRIRQAAASSPYIAVDIQQLLRADNDKDVRISLARNPYSSAETFDFLSNDKDEKVRGFVALNQHCPPHLVKHLLNDESEIVKFIAQAVGKND